MPGFWDRYSRDYRSIVKLGVPILIGQLGMIFVGFADNIMLGRYSTAALASSSLVTGLFNTAMFACIGFTYGLTPLVGALFGQKRSGDIGALMRNAVVINVIFSLLVTLVMYVIYLNLENMGQPAELLPLIRPYYLLYLAGLLPVALFNVFAQWSYAINRSKMPMWITLSSNVLNVIGNYALIYGNFGLPEMGLMGAGVSTLIARWICPIAIFAIFMRVRDYSEYRRGFAVGRQRIKQWGLINRTSWPIALQMVFESGSFTIAAVMVGWIGAVELAAYQVIVIVGSLGFCVYYSIGVATSVLVSNQAGIGDSKGERRVAWAGYHIMLVLAAWASLIFIFGGKWLIGAFTEDSAVLATTLSLIFPLVLYQLGDATQVTFANALRGTSHVTPVMWIAAISYIIVGVPATYLLGFTAGLGIYGVVLSFSVSLFLAGGLFLMYFLRATKGQH